jgi:hypothetical protein
VSGECWWGGDGVWSDGGMGGMGWEIGTKLMPISPSWSGTKIFVKKC